MRLGYLTYGLDRQPTGIGRYAVELLRALAELPNAPQIVLLTTEAEDCHGLWTRFERYAISGCRRLPGLLTVGNAALSMAQRRLGLDVVYDPNGIAPFLGPAYGVKRIVTVHDTFAYVCPDKHNQLDNWRYHWLLPRAVQGADIVATVSAASRRDIAQFFKLSEAQVPIVNPGVDPQFRPVPDSQARRAVLDRYGIAAPYILYLGGINPRKNIDGLLNAFAQVTAEHRPGVQTSEVRTVDSSTSDEFASLRLVIGGKPQWASSEIRDSLGRLELGEKVIFTDYIEDYDLPALYSAARVFVFPSLYEGFGIPPLEAMACGTPVVTSNVSSLPEVVADAAVLVDPYDTNAIARGIRNLLTDRELAAELRTKGLERARYFSWKRAATEMQSLYERLFVSSLMPAQAP